MSRKSLSLTAVTIVLVSLGLGLLPVLPAASAEAPGAWNATTSIL